MYQYIMFSLLSYSSAYESHVPQLYKEYFQAYGKRLWPRTATKHALYICCTFYSLTFPFLYISRTMLS
jgi:hypothetical protein